jgi:hypothetical protein
MLLKNVAIPNAPSNDFSGQGRQRLSIGYVLSQTHIPSTS